MKLFIEENSLYFFDWDSEMCYDKKTILAEMREVGIINLDCYVADVVRNADYFYCTKFYEVGEKSEGGCGKMCSAYKPRNGVSGRCVHSSGVYEKGKKITLRIK